MLEKRCSAKPRTRENVGGSWDLILMVVRLSSKKCAEILLSLFHFALSSTRVIESDYQARWALLQGAANSSR